VPLDLVTTGYGPPALHALRDALAAAKAGEPLAPVTVVVPSNHVGVAARRLLAGGAAGPVVPGGGGLAGVTFLTTYRLAELLGSARLAGDGRRPVSTPVIAAALRRALADDPGVFAPVAHHPATEVALVAAYTELSDLSDTALSAVGGASRRAGDVVRLCRRARTILRAAWYDQTDLAAAAVEAALGGDAVVGGVGHVVVHLVQDLSRRQATLLRAVADRWPTTVIAALSGAAGADAGVRRSLDRLGCKATGIGPPPADITPGPAPAAASGGPGGPGGTSSPLTPLLPVAVGRTRILTASDADDEVRAAVRAVVDAARRGTPLERVAVLFGAAEPYGRLLHEHLAAAGIARNGTAVRPLAASAVGRLLVDLLALPDHGFRRRDVMGLLTRSSLRTASGAPAPAAEWERLTREAGVVAGRSDWSDLLARLADGFDQRAADSDDLDDLAAIPPVDPAVDTDPPAPVQLAFATDASPTAGPGAGAGAGTGDRGADPDAGAGADGFADEAPAERPSTRADHLRRRAARTRELQAVVLRVIDELTEAGAAAQRWRTRVACVRRLAERLLGDERDRAAWPADEHRAAEKIDAALERLAALDAIDDPPTLEVFRRTLDLELDADLGRVGRFGEGVLVAPLSFAAGLDLDLVVVVGLAEGTLPGPVRDDSLLPDAERRRAGGELPLRRERIERDHRHLRAALAGADAHLLCAPRGDLRASNERVPSRWLLGAASALHGAPVGAEQLPGLTVPWLVQVPSFAHAVTHAAFPATAQDHRLRAGALAGRAPDPVTATGAAVIAARRSHAFTRFDGNLTGVEVPTPADGTVSSTRLEAWASCPHAYFVRYLLGVQPLDDPERQLSITPLDRGVLIHDVLERFIRSVVERPEAERPGPDDRWTEADHAAMASIAAEVCDDYEARGLTGRPVFWRRDRAQIVTLADRFLREDELHRRRTRTRPVAAELTFGRGEAGDGVGYPLPDGRELRFSGAIDRIDLADDGTLHVTDYKTGSDRLFKNLSADDPDQRGTKLQLAVYARAARAVHGALDTPVRADYWFVSDRHGFSRRGYVVDDDVLDRVSTTLAIIVAGIEAGLFPSRPEDSGFGWVSCEYCDPDGLGVSELRRDWERKRHDPLLVPYATLAEPLTDPPDPGSPDSAAAPGPGPVGASR
jgi:RecB family exonuclease